MADKAAPQSGSDARCLGSILAGTNILQQVMCVLGLWIMETAMEGYKDRRGLLPRRSHLHGGFRQQGQGLTGQATLPCLSKGYEGQW